MPAHWLLETDTFLEGNPHRMFEILQDMGMPVKWVKYVPFQGTLLDQFPDDACVVVYGSMNLAAQVQRVSLWSPGIWANSHVLRASTYLAHWGRYSVQRDYAMYPLGEIRRLLPRLLDEFGRDGTLFIRPNENDKSFSGTLISENNFERWLDQNTRCYDLDPTAIVLVSRPQEILSEHRFIVADGKIITGSKYRNGAVSLDGQDAVGFDPKAWEFAQRLLDESRWQPLRIFNLDVAQLPEGYALMEIGSVNSCGLYGCDLRIFVENASRIAVDDWGKKRHLA